jgi:hypothetical protein
MHLLIDRSIDQYHPNQRSAITSQHFAIRLDLRRGEVHAGADRFLHQGGAVEMPPG